MLNLDGIRQLIPTLPVLNAHALSLAEGYFVAALVVQLRGLDVRVSGHAPGDVDVTAAFKIVHDANGLKELVSYRSREMAEKVAQKVLSRVAHLPGNAHFDKRVSRSLTAWRSAVVICAYRFVVKVRVPHDLLQEKDVSASCTSRLRTCAGLHG